VQGRCMEGVSNSEFGIQSWMMMKITKKRGKCKRNKEKGQREEKERRKRVLVRMKIKIGTKSTRGYDGTYDYEGYDGTNENERLRR